MFVKTVAAFVLCWCFGVQVNFVLANAIPPSQIEQMPDMYSHLPTYPAVNNVLNYNASPIGPNPQYTPPNFNQFNEPIPQPSQQIPANYQKRDYQDYQQKPIEQPKPSDESVMTINPTTTSYDYSSDLKNTLVSVNDNLGIMADTQRMLLDSFKDQQRQYDSIDQKLNDIPYQRSSSYSEQPNYGHVPPAQQQQQQPYQYQLIAPPLPALPYGQSTQKENPVQPLKPAQPSLLPDMESSRKLLIKLIKKIKKKKLFKGRGLGRGLGLEKGLGRMALFQRRSESQRLERQAALALNYIKHEVLNALWTAVIVACVKLAPILLFGFKLMFKSILPLTGLALFGSQRGIFPPTLKQIDDDDGGDVKFENVEEEEEDDEEEEKDADDEDTLEEEEDDDDDEADREVSEEKGGKPHKYR